MTKTFLKVNTYPKNEEILDENIEYVIIVSRYQGKWIYVQHKERDTWELPWWHREIWESVLDGAKRELFEETWATKYDIMHIGYWSLVNDEWIQSFGAIFSAEIFELGKKPDSEISKIDFFDDIPKETTYPNVHPIIHKMEIEYKDITYNGVVIEESLENTEILEELDISNTKIAPVTERHKTPWITQWTMHTVDISEDKVENIANKLSKSLDSKHNWYADFKNNHSHYIIFHNKVFQVDRTKKEEYDNVTKYGINLGIPDYQLDFSGFIVNK